LLGLLVFSRLMMGEGLAERRWHIEISHDMTIPKDFRIENLAVATL